MNPVTTEWIGKAEGDFAVAVREAGNTPSPNFDVVCFLSQQCAEKYLNALLVEAAVDFPKIHDLEALLSLLLPTFPGLDSLRGKLMSLSDMAVEVRYPGFSADKEDAEEALELARVVREEARGILCP
ncbi:MAG TPA: HEPN domain-containing protein [Candidatus Hydrogenedentes bacterium]|nr:HEPN domain-containing protein [Candidatus Hydrogenedentota bacterium]